MTDRRTEPQADRMLALACDAAARARALGADFADVAVNFGRQTSVAFEANDIRLCEQHERLHFSVRAFVGGGMGLAGGDGDPGDLSRPLAEAVDMARLASRDPDFRDLPPPTPPLIADARLDLYDSVIAAKGLADAVALARDNIQRVGDLDGGVSVNGDVSFSAGWGVLAGATGVAVSRESTFADVSLFAVARDGDDVGSFSEYTMGRHWSDLRIDPLAGAVVRGARMYQHARPCPSGVMTLVLSPLAVHALIGALASATSAESIRRKRSLLTRRLGQSIGSPLLTLEDRPLEPRGVYSGAFDSEGAARRPVVLIDRGVFAEALTNHYNARLAGVANNGHGTRRGSVSPTNLQLRPGDRPEAELVGEVESGIYLHAGSLDPDLTSGDISTVLDFAYRIEHGRLVGPLAGAMVAGQLLDLLARVDAVSSDYRIEPGLILPSLRIRDVTVSGEA